MSGRPIQKGSTNVSSVVRIIDSTDGTPETGVTSATGGLAFNYRREGEAANAITALNDLAALTTAHTDGGILHIGDGYYRIDFQDAAFAAGAGEDGVLLTGTATGMIVVGTYHPLVDYDPVADIATAVSDTAVIEGWGLGATASDAAAIEGWGLGSVASDTAAIEVDTGTTLSAQITTIASDVVQIYSDTTAIHSETTEILVDTGTTLSAQVTTIASDVVQVYSDTTAIHSETTAILVDTGTTLSGQITTIASDVVQIYSDTTLLETNITIAAINATVDTALADVGLDHLVGASVVGTDVTDNSIIARMVSSSVTADWDDFVNTTDSLQAMRDRGDAAWTTGSGTGLTPLASGTAQGGTTSTIQLASGETFADDELNGTVCNITSGTGAGQTRVVIAYDGGTDTATVTPNWTTTPDSSSVYEVVGGSVNVTALGGAAEPITSDLTAIESELIIVHSETTLIAPTIIASGTAQGATSTSLQLAAAETFANDEIVGSVVLITGGSTGVGQSRIITNYIASTDTATVDTWTTTPTGTITYNVIANPPAEDTYSSDLAAIESELIQIHSETTAIQTDASSSASDTAVIEAWGMSATASDAAAIEAWGLSSVASDTAAIEVDTGTTLSAQVTTIASDVEQIYSDTTVVEGWGMGATASDAAAIETTVTTIASDTAAMETDITSMALGLITGTAQTGTLSDTQATTDLTGYTDDQLIGRVIIWTSGSVEGEATDITDYASSGGLLTFTALTLSVSNGDTFKIV